MQPQQTEVEALPATSDFTALIPYEKRRHALAWLTRADGRTWAYVGSVVGATANRAVKLASSSLFALMERASQMADEAVALLEAGQPTSRRDITLQSMNMLKAEFNPLSHCSNAAKGACHRYLKSILGVGDE